MSRFASSLALLPALGLSGCPQPAVYAGAPGGPDEALDVPAGSSCTDRSGCGLEQLCVERRCVYEVTSRAGEVLSVSARNQMDAGDFDGALTTYREAARAFEAKEAPLPAPVACGGALAALEVAESAPSREEAAREAYRCFRNSLPGEPLRDEVQARLARLRFDGLDLTHFDADEPPDRFFTRDPSRPSADAIQMSLDLPESDKTGFEQLRESLLADDARRAIGQCFASQWEATHTRSAEASLLLRFQSRLRDMGSYDVYSPTVSVEAPEEAGETPFGGCLAEALTEALAPGPRVGRTVSEWQEGFTVNARVQ